MIRSPVPISLFFGALKNVVIVFALESVFIFLVWQKSRCLCQLALFELPGILPHAHNCTFADILSWLIKQLKRTWKIFVKSRGLIEDFLDLNPNARRIKQVGTIVFVYLSILNTVLSTRKINIVTTMLYTYENLNVFLIIFVGTYLVVCLLFITVSCRYTYGYVVIMFVFFYFHANK